MGTNNNSPVVHAVILSGGEGTRFDSGLPKQYVKLAGKTILEYSIDAYEINPDIDSVIIVVSEDFLDLVKEIIQDNSYKKITNILIGGKSRIESSYCAIQSLSDDNDIIILHDAVRPLVSQKTISDSVAALKINDAIAVVIPCSDAMMETIDGNFINSMPARASLRKGFGPQGFRLGLLRKAHLMAIADQNTDYAEDCSLVLNYNLTDIYLVLGNTDNIKVTYPEDLYFAEALLLTNSSSLSTVNLADLKDKIV
jgi:2-C-methyl-D-erythritol 4-phosphate cytidylyltransferase